MFEKIQSIIGGGEGVSTEFKGSMEACPKHAYETVCAFLNHTGGEGYELENIYAFEDGANDNEILCSQYRNCDGECF